MKARVVAARKAHDFEATIGNDLVGVHVSRGAGSALDDADYELVVPSAVHDLLADLLDDVRLLGSQVAELAVCARCSLLHSRERDDQVGIVEDGPAGNRKVLESPRRVDAPVGIRGNVFG